MINPGDYITFTKMIRPAVKRRVRDSVGGVHDYEIEPAELIEYHSAGLVKRVNKSQKVFGTTAYTVGRVQTSDGVVTAVLDDAVLIGIQQHLFDLDLLADHAISMYQDGDHA